MSFGDDENNGSYFSNQLLLMLSSGNITLVTEVKW
jgi:hypothetical protein